MKTRIASILGIALLAISCVSTPQTATQAGKPAKNVIFLLVDGTGPEAWPLARWIKGDSLAVDGILTGAVRTYGADSIITDSAPGGSVYATGFKGSDKGIAVGAWNITIDAAKADPGKKYVPLATILEGARLTGRATGIIATSNIQHATPASFSSHWVDRNNYNELAEQQAYQGIDVVLSGGFQYLLPKEVQGGKREDGENLVDVLRGKGYSYVTTKAEMARITKAPVWGAFAFDAMAYDMDRSAIAPDEPSISEMTAKAIELLSSSAKGRDRGFFLFVEGSKVDWAAHSNDPVGVVSDLIAFDGAVKAALDYAKRDKNTLVVVVSDHATGGISIGTNSDKNYSLTDDDSVVGPMRKAKLSGEGVEKTIAGDTSDDKIKSVLAEQYGISDLTADELTAIRETITAKKFLNSVIGPMISKRARLGWTTGGHTGADVFMFSYGPGRLSGLMENSEVGRAMAASMGISFEALNERLFADADTLFSGYDVTINRTVPANPVLVVSKAGKNANFPFAKNVMIVNGKIVELEGIVVYSEKLNKVFLPKSTLDLVRKEIN